MVQPEKRILLILVIVVLFSSFTAAYTYQENANSTTFLHGPDNDADTTSAYDEMYLNYTKPAGSTGAIWQVRHGQAQYPAYNITIPSDCWNYYGDKIRMKFYSQGGVYVGKNYSTPFCYNGGWKFVGVNRTDSPNTGHAGYGGNYYTKTFDGDWNSAATVFQYGGYIGRGFQWGVFNPGSPQYNSSGMIFEEGVYWDSSGLPTQGTPIINTSLGTNKTWENVTVYNTSTYDPNGDPVLNIVDWKLNGQSLAFLNMPFEGGSDGSNTRDYSSYGNNATVNGPTWTSSSGHSSTGGYCYNLDSDDIYIPSSSEQGGMTQLTISAWIKASSIASYDKIVEKWNSPPDASWALGFNTASQLRFSLTNGATTKALDSTPTVSTGVWVHVAATYDGTKTSNNMKIYINGVSVGTTSAPTFGTGGALANPSEPIYIGSYLGTGYAPSGCLDDIMVFNKTLSDEQIKSLYNDRTNQIDSNMNNDGDTWQGCITPNDGTGDGVTKCSAELTVRDCYVPYDDMSITTDTKLCSGTYYLSDAGTAGVIQFGADGITLTCDGTKIVGTGGNYGIYAVSRSLTRINGCSVGGFAYYGAYLSGSPISWRKLPETRRER